jgi:hypothetical protein
LFGAVRVADFLATDQAKKVMPELMKLSGDKLLASLALRPGECALCGKADGCDGEQGKNP